MDTQKMWRCAQDWALRPAPYNNRWGFYLQIVAIIMCVIWSRVWPPIPAVAIGFLGVVAAVMTVRADRFTSFEKVVWVLISATLFIIEVKAVRRDRDEFAAQQLGLRKEENSHFAGILQQNQNHFDTSLRKMEAIAELSGKAVYFSSNALQQITGGGQYCYLVGLPIGPGLIALGVVNSGPLPLDRCSVVVRHKEAPSAHSLEEAVKTFEPPLLTREFGPLPPGETIHPSRGFTLRFSTAVVEPLYDSYKVEIHTRNEDFTESLTVPPEVVAGQNKDKFERIEIRDTKGKRIYLGNINFSAK